MRDSSNPDPKRRPANNAVTNATRSGVPHEEHGDRGDAHESQGREERSPRQIGKAAHAVPTVQPFPRRVRQTHEQTRRGQHRQVLRKLDTAQAQNGGRQRQPEQKGDAPATRTKTAAQAVRKDAADSSDLAVQEQQRRRPRPDERAAEQRLPIVGHHVSTFGRIRHVNDIANEPSSRTSYRSE